MNWSYLQRERRRVQKALLVPIFVGLIFSFGLISFTTGLLREEVQADVRHRVVRAAPYDECHTKRINPNASSDQFPPDLFSLEQRQRGAVVLHLGGLVYMFVALAIVCDEFFVPSLSVLIKVLDISEDVAGATFMAAGGSAPEFFTSVFGVFVAQNNVGIGTIVGSATFNILCVLAFCTLFSREVLHLTWWPLFRDMSFYIIGLLFLVIFFADEKISWYEALTMLLIYVIYGLFMKYNSNLECRVKGWLNGNKELTMPTIALSQPEVFSREPRRSIPMIHGGTQLRNGIAKMAIGSEDESDHEQHHQTNANNHQHKALMVKPVEDRMFVRTNIHSLPTVSEVVQGKKAQNSKITPVEISDSPWTSQSEFLIQLDVSQAYFDGKNGDNKNSNHSRVIENGHPVQFQPASELSIDSSDEQPLDLSWPDMPLKQFIFILLAPIMFPLAYTLPDVRNPGLRSWFLITFIGSVLWIALFSYLMVWWANTIGETFGIPTEIMGLTILAAGTSIPDLITSVIVARKGLGDMAVSSSIGSNLFDICVGLPIPWLFYFILALFRRTVETFPTVSVVSNGLICSVGMLFVMLTFLVLCIALSRWRMDKFFGLLMIISYVIFCIFSIILETGRVTCPLRITSDSC